MSHSHNYIGVGPEGLTGEAAQAAEEAFANGSVKIHVTLPPGSKPPGEYMWATPVWTVGPDGRAANDRTFKIDNIPFSDVGFTMEAVVEADPVVSERVYEFVRVHDRGPWRQVWFGTIGSHGQPVLDAIMAQHPEGKRWKYEAMHTCSFVAVCRGEDALEDLKDTLSDLCAAEIVGFYWDDNDDGEMADSVVAEMENE